MPASTLLTRVPLHDPITFPLFDILPDGTCACGDPACKRVGKHPAVAWGELEAPVPYTRGHGIKTGARPRGSGIFVVDLDGDPAIDAWNALEREGGEVRTREVETPRGAHLYFEHPGFPVKNSAGALAPGIDIRGEGGFVVGPGSPHRSGGTYRLAELGDPRPAPAWLVDWLRERSAPTEIQTYPGDVEGAERERRRGLYAKYLREEAPPRGPERRGRGDATLFDVVQRGAYDMQLPTADVLELVREHYDPRCSPMWGDELEERVRHKAHSAKTQSTRPRAEPWPADVAVLLEPPPLPPPEPRKKRGRTGIVWGGWDEPVEPPTYLVDGLIPVSTVGMFVAMGSSLKTWTALDIARCVSKGAPWLGRFATRKGRVLIVDYESGMYELRRRIHVLEGGEIGDLGAWVFPDVRIDSPEFWKEVARVKDLALVIIDSLAAGAPVEDENKTSAAIPLRLASILTEALESDERPGPSVLFIHHAKKDQSGDARTAVRGSTAIYADCDWVYKFDRPDEARPTRMQMVSIKPCMGPAPPPTPLELGDGGLFWSDEADQTRVRAVEDTPEAIQAAIKLSLANGPIETKQKIARAVGRRAERVSPEIDALVVREEVVHLPGRGYVLESLAARADRIVEAVQGYPWWKSPGAIAKAAFVPTAAVEALVREGVICRSAEGRWMIVSPR